MIIFIKLFLLTIQVICTIAAIVILIQTKQIKNENKDKQ